MGEPVLQASWVVEEADLRAAARALPGSTLGLLRWPVAFFVAYVGVGVADPRVGAPFAFGSAAVIAVGWIVISLARRGTAQRKIACLPETQRTMWLTLGDDGIRLAAASGHASEQPLAELTHVLVRDSGILLNLNGDVVLVPRRALAGDEAAWHALVKCVPPRRWPKGLVVTLGLWAFAAAVAAYANVATTGAWSLVP